MLLKSIQLIFYFISKQAAQKGPPRNLPWSQREENLDITNFSQHQSNIPENSKPLDKEAPTTDADLVITRLDLIQCW